MISMVAEYVADLGLEVAKHYTKSKIEELKLRKDLVSFVSSQHKYNFLCSLAEELDFQGLVNYVEKLDQWMSIWFEVQRNRVLGIAKSIT